MHKLSLGTGHEQQYVHAASYSRRQTQSGSEYLVAGLPYGESRVFLALVERIEEPLFILYVLHTPRGEGNAGRYQSPELSMSEVREFVKKFSSYLSADSRFDLWVYSPSMNATVVWDRHNLIHAYGLLIEFESALRAAGYELGNPNISNPHIHHYRPECDEDAKSVLAAYQWRHTPLKPEDEQ